MALGQRTNGEHNETARRILEHARRAFNERGVGSVGMREIARELDLSPGNVSYYFATKEALIAALVEDVHAQNTALVAQPAATMEFSRVAAIVRAIMERDLEQAWLMRDYARLLFELPALRAIHDRLQPARLRRVDVLVQQLIEAGLLDPGKLTPRIAELRRQVLTQVFFWLPAAIVDDPDRDPADAIDTHLRAVLALFAAYCTPAGRRQLDRELAAGSRRRARNRAA